MRLLTTLALAILTSAVPPAWAYDVHSFYVVGNSLTNDSGPGGLPSLFQENTGQAVQVGYHIRSASTLSQIWTAKEPSTAGNGKPIVNGAYGPFEQGLPNYEWDAVTLQIHPRNGATLNNDVAAIVNFVNLAKSAGKNANTRFYTYAPWPEQDEWDLWDDPAPAPTASAKPAAAYHAAVVEAARAATGLEIGMVPMGEVWNQVRLATLAESLPAMGNGQLPQIAHFYRDNLHASDLGRYLNGMTLYATILGRDPTLATVPESQQWFYGDTLLTDELALALQQIIWDVVTSEPLTLVQTLPGDFNDDGVVDAADYVVWRNHVGEPNELALGGNGSGGGGVDIADYELWKANYSAGAAGVPAAMAPIPEPSGIVLGVAALVMLVAWRTGHFRPARALFSDEP